MFSRIPAESLKFFANEPFEIRWGDNAFASHCPGGYVNEYGGNRCGLWLCADGVATTNGATCTYPKQRFASVPPGTAISVRAVNSSDVGILVNYSPAEVVP
jgi:hypothetical protein